MKCPICKRSVVPSQNQNQPDPYPFCSERCKLIDLGRWLDGRYQIPAEIDEQDRPEDPGPPPRNPEF